jgi:hypothetical protein
VALIRFDPDDLDAAYTELDARYDAGEAAAYPHAAAWLRAFLRLSGTRDWDAVAARCAPTFVAHDHRLVGWGTLRESAAWVRTLRVLIDLAPDARYRMDHVRMSDRAWLVEGGWVGTRDGGPFEIATISVSEVDDLGRTQRNDVYELEQLDQARARFDAIGASPAIGLPATLAKPDTMTAATPTTRFANAASRAWYDRLFVFWRARDWQRMAQHFAVGLRYVDRRRMVQLELDRDRFIEFTRQLGDMSSAHLESEMLATRGDRLVLLRFHVEVADAEVGPSELEYLNLIEVDERGDAVLWVRFDADDLDAAYAELDARYDAGEAAAHGRAAAFQRAFRRAFANRDWDMLPALFAPALVMHDRRLLGWGTVRGVSEYIQVIRSVADLAPDVRFWLVHLRMSDRGILCEGAYRGTQEGGAFENPFLVVWGQDELGKVHRVDVYEIDQLDQARARFDALGASTARDPLAAFAKPNAATAAMDRLQAAFDARDWTGVRAACTPDARFEDRRRQALISGDIDLWLADMRGLPVLAPNVRCTRSLVGTAGDRLALERHLWSGGPPDGPIEIEGLFLTEVDESGRIARGVVFDLDDPRAAQREAWSRWIAADARAPVEVALLAEMLDAMNNRDRARWRAALADGLIVEDHRRTGMGRIEGADAYLDSVDVLWELAPASGAESGWFWPAYDRHVAVTVLRHSGTLVDGGAFQSDYLWLFTSARGHVTCIEYFEIDALDAALARFAELSGEERR